MSSVVTTSGNGLKMKIQRKSQRQVADLESNNNNNNNNSALVTPLATAKTKGGAELPSQEDNKIKKMVDDCGKSGANKMPHGAKSKCKGMKQAKYGKEKKIKKKFEKVLKNFQENDSVPEGESLAHIVKLLVSLLKLFYFSSSSFIFLLFFFFLFFKY